MEEGKKSRGKPEAPARGGGQRRNYQKELEKLLSGIEETNDVSRPRKRLLIHSCCAPCSSYVLFYLKEYFDITVLYYNPNITDAGEYGRRVAEQERLVTAVNEVQRPPGLWQEIALEKGRYDPREFYEIARGLENVPEGGERCFRCYELRLRETAKRAAAGHFDYFTTTLTISPMKDTQKLNEIGNRMGQEYGVPFLPSDFKKKDGYKRSVELSREYGLYRQDYCGCVYSRQERDRRVAAVSHHTGAAPESTISPL